MLVYPTFTGSQLQRALQAAIAAGSSPYLAEIIKNNTPNDGARVIAHAVVNAVLARAQGNSAAAGAAGAAVGEMTGILASNIYQTSPDKLTEEQKQTISALATLASGLSGAIIGNGTADAVAAAQAGKTTVENNYLNSSQVLAFDKEMQACKASGKSCSAVVDKYKKLSDQQSEELAKKLKDKPLVVQNVDKVVIENANEITERPAWIGKLGGEVMNDAQAKAYVQYWNTQDLSKIDTNSPTWTKFATFVSDPENEAAVASLGIILGKHVFDLAKSYSSKSVPVPNVNLKKISINNGQQNKHILGTNEYKISEMAGNKRSVLTLPANSLLPQLGKGKQIGNIKIGLPGSKERVNFGKIIGNFVDQNTGEIIPTTKGIVHYGKNGAHIVPARP